MAVNKAINVKLRRRMPPLNPLRAFEAVARHLSFARAADELAVTSGAVSRSVSALEEYLGVPLLERNAAGLSITPASQEFARALGEAFTRISTAVDELFEQRSHFLLTVQAYTAFLVAWLIPNLASFHQLHPEIEVRLISANERVRLDSGQADVRIQYGRGQWRGRKSVFLFPDAIGPVCSPLLLLSPLEDTKTFLESAPLLVCNMRRNDWPDWLQFAGIAELIPSRELYFEEASVMYEAASAGMGIAIAQHAHVRNHLEAGRLVALQGPVLERDTGYYATYRGNEATPPAALAFCEWLRELTSLER
jgi:LysR family glycine cleavage system transcriptional activator